MPPRIHPDRPLSNQEKQARRYARTKEARAYVAALEAAVVDVSNWKHAYPKWHSDHAPTIARARAARGTAATTTED